MEAAALDPLNRTNRENGVRFEHRREDRLQER